MILWHAQNISYMMIIMTTKFHNDNVCDLPKKRLKYIPSPLPLLHRMWNRLENFYVKQDSITLRIMKNCLGKLGKTSLGVF